MNFENRYKIDGAITATAAAIAWVLAWLSSLVGPLKSLGATSPPAQILVVAVVAACVLGWRLYQRQTRLRELLELTPRALCRVDSAALGEVESELALKTSRDGKVRYVERNGDANLLETLKSRQVVILIGSSGAGKSSIARAVANRFGANNAVFIPRKPAVGLGRPVSEALFLLSAKTRRRRAAWLWLDDLGRYLDSDAIEIALVRRWLDGHQDRRVVATLSSKDRNQLEHDPTPSGDSARALLHMASKPTINVLWRDGELARAKKEYPGAGENCRQLGRYLSSGDFHLQRLHDAEESCAEAAAVLQAATDWRRARLPPRIPESFLRKAFSHYLAVPPRDYDLDALFDRGLAWATDRMSKPEAILEPRPESPGYLALADVAVEVAAGQGVPIPRETWVLLFEEVRDSPDEVILAVAALAQGVPDMARPALEKMLENQALAPSVQALARAAWDELQSREASGVRGDFGASRAEAREAPSAAEPARLDEAVARSYNRLLRALSRRSDLAAAVRVSVLIVFDAIGLWLALMAAYIMTQGPERIDLSAAQRATDQRIAYVTLLAVLLFARSDLYRGNGRAGNPARILAALTQASIALLALRVLAGDRIGSYALLGWSLLFACVTVPALREGFARGEVWVSNHARGRRRRCALLGTDDQVEAVAAVIRADDPGRELVGFVGPPSAAGSSDSLPWLGDARISDDLMKVVYRHGLDELVLCDPYVSEDRATGVADLAWDAGVRLRAVAPGRNFLVTVSSYIPGEPLPLEELTFPVLQAPEFAMKRAFDLAVAGALMVLLFPVFVLVAAAIKLTSKGRLIQELSYPGLGGITFGMRKFRVSHVSATGAELGPPTTVGRFIQAIGLDELPQLINVLKGEMSLVGPRPISPTDFDRLEPWQRNRYLSLPGITGLWQISGRSDTSFSPMVRLDLYYVQHWSVFLDIEILFKTVTSTLRRRRATLAPAVELDAGFQERRAAFGPKLLAAMPGGGLSLDAALELAGTGESQADEVFGWLAGLQRKGWLEVRGDTSGDGRGPRFGLNQRALAHLADDPRR